MCRLTSYIVLQQRTYDMTYFKSYRYFGTQIYTTCYMMYITYPIILSHITSYHVTRHITYNTWYITQQAPCVQAIWHTIHASGHIPYTMHHVPCIMYNNMSHAIYHPRWLTYIPYIMISTCYDTSTTYHTIYHGSSVTHIIYHVQRAKHHRHTYYINCHAWLIVYTYHILYHML